MAKKKYFLTIDTETTQTGMVADFGAVVSDKAGNIIKEVGLLIGDFYSDKEAHPLFHIYGDAKDVFSKASLPARYARYDAMLQDGRRMLCSVAAVNRWLVKVAQVYDPVMTAYNIAFDLDKMGNSGILARDLFPKRFCLWHAAAAKWSKSREFRAFVLKHHNFGNRTAAGHMGYQTKAEVMARYLLGEDYPAEPHTALEDARDYEVPILTALVKNTSPAEYMYPPAYNWRDYALRDNYIPK